MWRDTLLMAGKDLRIEARSRVALSQVAPFGVIALVLFAFALGPDRSPMAKAAPGLFWVAILFSTVLAIQRSVSVESVDGARGGLRLSGLDPAGVFLGKTAAVAVQLLILEAILGVGVVLLYWARMNSIWLAVVACIAGTIGLAAAGTLLPLHALAAADQAALAGGIPSQGTPWVRLLIVFDAVYLALGVVVFGPIQESA